jgi:hypothetical protein
LRISDGLLLSVDLQGDANVLREQKGVTSTWSTASPDGPSFLFSQLDEAGSDLLLEENSH